MFRTFSKVAEKKFTVGKFLVILMAVDILIIVGLLTVSLFPQFYRKKDFFLESTFTLNMVLVGIFLLAALNYVIFSGRNRSRPVGQVEILEDRIVVDEEIIPIAEVEKLRLIGNDVKGDFRGFISKGIRNQMVITQTDGTVSELIFEQTSANKLLDRKEILAVWHQKGKLSDSNYQNILRNTNYY